MRCLIVKWLSTFKLYIIFFLCGPCAIFKLLSSWDRSIYGCLLRFNRMFNTQSTPCQTARAHVGGMHTKHSKPKFWKTRGQTNQCDKGLGSHRRLFDMENSALNWPKLENCAQTLLGNCANDVKGSLHIIIIDKQFLTLDWKSCAKRCIFDLNYLLLNANIKRKMVINQYLRCLFGQKKVVIKILRLSCSPRLNLDTLFLNFQQIRTPFYQILSKIWLCV